MNRLSLQLQLALILACAMTVMMALVIAIDWVNTVYEEINHDTGEADKNALQLLELRTQLDDTDFATARFLTARPDNWIHYGPWDGLHPWDEVDETIAQQLRNTAQVGRAPVDELIVATRHFTYHRVPRNAAALQPGPVRSAPTALSINNQRRVFTRDMPQDGKPRRWVTQPELDESGEVVIPTYLGPDGRLVEAPGSSVTVYTIAMLPQGSEDWIVLHKFMRAPNIGGTIAIGLYTFIAAVVLAILALLLGRRVMAPFRRLADQAELLGRGERAPDIAVEGPQDVREIVTAFNSMNARITQATDYQIGLLRSLGHDLKGPLAAVKRLAGNVQPHETRDQIETRLERVDTIVQDIMSFSRAVMRDGDPETTDLASMVEAIVDEHADLGVDAEAQTPDKLLLRCRANAVERCIRNLVENAVKYGGCVRANLFQDGDEAVIQIDDTGPGIPEAEIERVFQPFHRLADDDRGSGLGLAIARTIVIDQGGTLTLSNRSDGGLRADVRLPGMRTSST